jgi:hypothetical protein
LKTPSGWTFPMVTWFAAWKSQAFGSPCSA